MKELQRAMIPGDENGVVLRAMLDDGDDLSREREIVFYLVFAQEAQAQAFAAEAAGVPDLQIEGPEADEEGFWQVAAVRRMAASHAGITGLEQRLATLAQAHGGHPDGWSCDPADAAE